MVAPSPGEYVITTEPISTELVPRAVYALQQLGIAFNVVSFNDEIVSTELMAGELPPDAVAVIDSTAYPYNYEQGAELLELEPDERFLLDCIVGSGLIGVRRREVFKAGLGSDMHWKDRAKAYDKAHRDLRKKLKTQSVPFLVMPLGAKSAMRYVCLVDTAAAAEAG